jgi:hypothetical protein
MSLSSCEGADHQKWFGAFGDACGKSCVRRIVGQIFLAREEPDERASLMRDVIADRTAEYGVLRLKGVEYRPQRRRAAYLHAHLAVDTGERPEVSRQFDANHWSV